MNIKENILKQKRFRWWPSRHPIGDLTFFMILKMYLLLLGLSMIMLKDNADILITMMPIVGLIIKIEIWILLFHYFGNAVFNIMLFIIQTIIEVWEK